MENMTQEKKVEIVLNALDGFERVWYSIFPSTGTVVIDQQHHYNAYNQCKRLYVENCLKENGVI